MLEARRRIGLFLALAVAFAAMSAYAVTVRVATVEAQLGDIQAVLVATRTVPAQSPLTADDFRTASIPSKFIQPGMVTDAKELEGKVSLVPLREGEVVTASMLTARLVVPQGFRVVRLYRNPSIAFDENLLAGDRVDLIATHLEQKEQVSTRVFLADLPVVETDAKGGWVGIQVRDTDATNLLQMLNTARQVYLLRLSPDRGGATR